MQLVPYLNKYAPTKKKEQNKKHKDQYCKDIHCLVFVLPFEDTRRSKTWFFYMKTQVT